MIWWCVLLPHKFASWLATGLGVGYLRPGPGTWGSILALPLGWLLVTLPIWHMLLCIVLFIAATVVAQIFINQHPEDQDPSVVVIDEVLGMLIAVVWLPQQLIWFVAAFIIFRLLDIVKPFPVSWFDKNGRGGFGIVADDVVAGVITNMILQGIFWYLKGGL